MNGCFHRGEIYHILPEDNETGSEQYSGRPAIIVSNEANNKFAPTLEVVYLTTSRKRLCPRTLASRLPDSAPSPCASRSTPLPRRALATTLTSSPSTRSKMSMLPSSSALASKMRWPP